MRPNRRTFLGTIGTLAAAAPVWSNPPSERVRIAVIGCRGRGSDLAAGFAQNPSSQVVAICDVDDAGIAKGMKAVEGKGGETPRAEKDFRKLLDDRSIDALAIATPDHWHAPMAILGCLAGKDVYSEKPASHNLIEGRRMVQAARKHNRVVQIGTQRRSATFIQDATQHVRSGEIGKVGQARAWINQQRKIDVSGSPQPVPSSIDYDLWQGPAQERPYIPSRFNYNWHWFWNWGTGELGNNGIHGVDVARWGLGVDTPLRVTSGGGAYVFPGIEVPDTQVVTWEFADTSIVWEHRMWSRHGLEGGSFGIAFYGDNGTVLIDDKGWRVVDGPGGDAGGKPSESQSAHFANFLECVKTRKQPNADVEIGHLSTRLCHLGNIAHRLGRKLTFDGATETFPGDDEANKLLGREYRQGFELPAIA
ncbi:MAG: Gfo/Idh/MocA family oxidoreductase [Isosphaeraceae bacterium]